MSLKLPQLCGRDVIRALERGGFEEKRWRGSHCLMARRTPDGELIATVPVHGARPLKPGTLSGIIRQARLSRKEFERLVRGK